MPVRNLGIAPKDSSLVLPMSVSLEWGGGVQPAFRATKALIYR
jgi:hypothetical protein